MTALPAEPTTHIVFGTNQPTPAEVAAGRYHQGLAPLLILTGGANRHNDIVEAREHRRILVERGVPEGVIRCEDTSVMTRQNAELEGSPRSRVDAREKANLPGASFSPDRGVAARGTSGSA